MTIQASVTNPGTIPSVSSLISGRTVQGTKVFSPAGDDLGHIDDIMIDAPTGKVVYGVLQFGGFLGIGSDHYPIPFGRLRYDSVQGGYVTDLTKEDLESAPPADRDWYENREWQRRNYDHYGVPYYWP
ncbi:PRC-barrel domain-containing protein [Xinfangfangia sp. D13-10-4-6]|uniref:PRC-barrel domain-containing protein n=1 Tax=Pseudogemmobacter hezensis TaxID=2737662 RepID=UPI00155495A5|nr:PRC-barrel domain-containing protein [Pseudogemmobacter hezensis]NPD15800.1 PRC-barrel domain-containing protein [Pseudogemmobacter hezensis]